ncbi:hypothetical protein EC844_1367 [Acinetobacter calcoaceticus]|uniref:DcaP-like protein n=1 Tax=Acinetobacter calcoaceticus TaxID=471 RepID=A0A4R1X8W9_ACICA|nr:hypothetical protein EC844_1367 [Acinetobacter calcoaceticus]
MISNFKKIHFKIVFLIIICSTTSISGQASNSNSLEIAQLQKEVEELKLLMNQYNLERNNLESNKLEKKSNQISTALTPLSSATNLKKVTEDSATQFNFYGFIRADASYQFKGGNGIFNRIHKIDLEPKLPNRDRFYSNMNTSKLGVETKTTIQNNDIGGRLEVDFRGGSNNDTIRLRHVYITFNNWLVGQTTSSFIATDLQPEMLDFGSPLGIGSYRTPLIRYENKFDSNTAYFISMEKGRDENRFPALSAKLNHSFKNKQGSVSARTMIQQLRIPTLDDKTEFSWGVALGASYALTPRLKLIADYTHLKGDDKYILYSNVAYLENQAINEAYLNEFDSFTAGITYQFTPKLRSTLGYGAMFANDDNGFSKQDILSEQTQNKTLQQGWMNIMYTPIDPITIGVEYVHGQRKTFNDDKGTDSRIGTMLRYNF